MKTFIIVTVLLLTMICTGFAGDKPQKASASHKRGICAEIVKRVDVLLYDNPGHHAPTTSCSYTDERLLIKPKEELSKDRMTRFVFLAFMTVGFLRNDDYMMPTNVYVGYGTECRVLSTDTAAKLQASAKYDGDLGYTSALAGVANARRTVCPK